MFPTTLQELKVLVEDVAANVPDDEVQRPVASPRKRGEKCVTEGRSP